MAIATAPGKVILLGEHAAVYGRPAIAVPVTQVQARAQVRDAAPGQGVTLIAADLGRTFRPYRLRGPAGSGVALSHTVRNALERIIPCAPGEPDLEITLSSTIPLSRGLGSGAAVATALVRALAAHYRIALAAADVSDLVYQTEIIYHGTPSGIDNTVIAFELPVYFSKGRPPVALTLHHPCWLIIGDSGIASSTRAVVSEVRERWQIDRAGYEARFDAIGSLVDRARQAMEAGSLPELGRLMNANQDELRAIGVSSPELETLVVAALAAGALGAKLAGSGRGGNMIALVEEAGRQVVRSALLAAGAQSVIMTRVS